MMKRFVQWVGLAVLALTLTYLPVRAEPPVSVSKTGVKLLKSIPTAEVAQYLQDISVTIRAQTEGGGGAEGSGVLKVTKDGQVWVWTCGHLVKHLRTTRKSPDEKTIVEFSDAKLIKVLVEDGRKVGESNFDAEVIRYSDADYGEDLALLRLRTKRYTPQSSVVFYLDKSIPAIGTDLLHCGSLLGEMGSNSVTSGIVSQHGRLINKVVFDQTNATSFPGSSGGIVCLRSDGRYVGMLVRGAGEGFSLYVPVRRIQDWAKKVGVEFAMNDAVPVPTDEDLFKKPVDDSVRQLATSSDKPKTSPYEFKLRIVSHMPTAPARLEIPWLLPKSN
jgi:hypothetical protein